MTVLFWPHSIIPSASARRKTVARMLCRSAANGIYAPHLGHPINPLAAHMRPAGGGCALIRGRYGPKYAQPAAICSGSV